MCYCVCVSSTHMSQHVWCWFETLKCIPLNVLGSTLLGSILVDKLCILSFWYTHTSKY